MTTLLRMHEVARRIGVHRATIYRLIANGALPPPVRLSGAHGQRGGAVAWPEAEIERYGQKLISERDAHQSGPSHPEKACKAQKSEPGRRAFAKRAAGTMPESLGSVPAITDPARIRKPLGLQPKEACLFPAISIEPDQFSRSRARDKFSINKTNVRTLIKAYGEDGREWLGLTIELYAGETTYQNQPKDSVLVRPISRPWSRLKNKKRLEPERLADASGSTTVSRSESRLENQGSPALVLGSLPEKRMEVDCGST